MFRSKLTGLAFPILLIFLLPCFTTIESKCSKGCDLALGSYYVWTGVNLSYISQVFDISFNDIVSYNTELVDLNSVISGTRINLPFTCDCIDGEFLGHVFPYSVQSGDTYDRIATEYFANLTTVAMLARFNSYPPHMENTENAVVNVTVNCSCGNASVSKAYGLFITYPLRVEDSLESISAAEGVSGDLLQRFNPGANFSAGSGLVYIPAGGTDSSFFVSKLGCQLKCGKVTVPYPFGIGSDCSIGPWFNITCDTSSYPPKPYIGDNTFEVLHISQTQVWTPIHFIHQCYNQSGGLTTHNGLKSGLDYISFPFSISDTANKVTAVGCNDLAFLWASDTQGFLGQIGGCLPSCWGSVNFTTNCNGFGCCQSDIPKGLQVVGLDIVTVANHSETSSTWIYSHCTYAFIGEQDRFQFHGVSDLLDPSFPNRTMDSVSMVLDFVIGNQSCVEAQNSKAYLCQQNTSCIDSNSGRYGGYICSCKMGYKGNPYLSPGCTDIDECKVPKKNNCKDNAICNNTPGSYTCTGQGPPISSSSPLLRPLLLGVGIATIVLILIALGFWLYRHFERRKKIRIKQKLIFERNGGLLFQQLITSSEGSVMKAKLFTAEELEKATDKFNQSRVLGKGGLGTVYKGMLQDGSIVAVKRSNIINENQVGQFINEVSILLQIDHRNIVKLLGCCLETEVPLLVYEYVSNGTLSHHLHDEGCVSTISWENRLRIAKEVAGALAYLHSYASTSIFHRDIKSCNILLDENFRAVVSDFGLSRSVSVEKTHLTTVVGGTFGYIDPEYFWSGQFTDKSDVYAFGVVLAELITGVKAVSLDVSKLGLVMYFQSSLKQNRLFEILDPLVLREGLKEDILVVAKLAKRCLKLNVKKRPSMREVAADLDRLTGKQIQPSHELICRDNYLSGSECSYFYATDGITEDCSHPSLVFPNHTA